MKRLFIGAAIAISLAGCTYYNYGPDPYARPRSHDRVIMINQHEYCCPCGEVMHHSHLCPCKCRH